MIAGLPAELFDETRVDQAPPRPVEKPAPASGWELGLLAAGGLLLCLAALTYDRWRARAWRAAKGAIALFRRFALPLACAGAVLVLADQTLLERQQLSGVLRRLHRQGWLSFGGGTLAIIGIYTWVKRGRAPPI